VDGHRRDGGEECALCGVAHAAGPCPAPRWVPDTVELRAAIPPPAPDALVGATVGSFRVQRLLGRGGMGSVYLAEHPIIGSKVAIKFLHESMSASPAAVGRFYDEARAVNLIGHENIVAIYDLALLPPSRYYIVMEYLDGAPLSALLRGGRLAIPKALGLLVQLTSALQAAHDHGVVHRDLKPENVFVLQRGERDFVKLVDFGIAKLADRSSSAGRTAAGSIVGTPEYMAPEQCENRHVDHRTDVYALGVMAYELATGHLPFTGTSIPRILLAQLRDAPRPPRELDPAVAPALEAAILKALAKDPAERFQDMRSFGAALEAARRGVAPAGPAAPAPPAPGTRAPGATLEVAVRGADGAWRTRAARDVTRGGLFVLADDALPPLRARVTVRLRADAGGHELEGEVVRHVTPADAARWGMSPGYAVQLGALPPAQRAAVEALAARFAEPPALTPVFTPSPRALEELEKRAAAGPYELLGARPEAGFPEIRERARAVRQLVEALRPTLSADALARRVPALLARVDAAVAQLGTPAERLMFDARRGNFQGVAHCVTAGMPPAVVAARRGALLAERPAEAARAQRHLARAQVAAKLGNATAALAEYEAALAADPLDLELHRVYWELKRGARRPG
jgi:eukaryotic-like serine/threonine-protein kinase